MMSNPYYIVALMLASLAALALGIQDDGEGLRYAGRLRSRFERQFNTTCLKYPFVQRFIHQIENPGDKYVVFVYHEPGLRNGGLGDRIGGLITATSIALRTNRTILIESANDFGSLFRPYHPADIYLPQPQQRYTWSNWTQWSRYNVSYSNNDNTEYDLWDCINCVTWKNRACGMDDGDVPHPIVKLRANRAFLCKWMKHPETQAHRELASLGITRATNLLEAAGCMLRLVMWPTEKLWAFVAKEVNRLDIFQRGPSITPVNYGIQIGLHFRCGDQSYKHPGSYDRACVHDITGKDPHPESDYMRFSSPDMLGRCAAELVYNFTHGLSTKSEEMSRAFNATRYESFFPSPRRRRMDSAVGNDSSFSTSSVVDDWDARPAPPVRSRVPILYIASDNPASAAQMNSTASWPHTFISPKGCHVELNPSADCTIETTAYWILLAGSDLIVTQTERGLPISAFSRYAAVYGLKGDSLRDAANCSVVQPFFEMSHKWAGNWFCD